MISRKLARNALRVLMEKGLITPDQAKVYDGIVEEGISYRAFMMAELGKITGELYVREEEAQHLAVHGIRVPLDKVSVPEMLVLEDDPSAEPWHNERFAEKSSKERFEQEAAEPWHPSLLDRFRPDPGVLAYFKANPEYGKYRSSILKMAYGV